VHEGRHQHMAGEASRRRSGAASEGVAEGVASRKAVAYRSLRPEEDAGMSSDDGR